MFDWDMSCFRRAASGNQAQDLELLGFIRQIDEFALRQQARREVNFIWRDAILPRTEPHADRRRYFQLASRFSGDKSERCATSTHRAPTYSCRSLPGSWSCSWRRLRARMIRAVSR